MRETQNIERIFINKHLNNILYYLYFILIQNLNDTHHTYVMILRSLRKIK